MAVYISSSLENVAGDRGVSSYCHTGLTPDKLQKMVDVQYGGNFVCF